MYKENLTTIFIWYIVKISHDKNGYYNAVKVISSPKHVLFQWESQVFKPGPNFSAVNRLISHLMHMFFLYKLFTCKVLP